MAPRPSVLDRLAPLIVGIAVIFVSLAPFGGGDEISPNALLAVFALWALRREEALSRMVVFGCGLFYEVFQDGPFGAETMALLLATEALRTDYDTRRFRPFWTEALYVGVAAAAFEAGVWALLAATLASPPAIAGSIERVLATVLLYTALAAIAQWLFGFTARVSRDSDPAA